MNKSVSSNEWNVLYETKKIVSRYPHDSVVRWTFVNFRDDFVNKPNILDVGCGGGRHSIFLAELGCNVTAVDYSSNAIEMTDLWAEEKALQLDTEVTLATALPYDDSTFTAVISYGVLCYMDFDSILQSVKEMHRVLKPEGKLFVVTRTNNDSRYITGNRRSNNHAVVSGDKSVPWQVEIGMDMTFLNEEDVKHIFRDFSGANIEKQSFTMCDGQFLNDDWVVSAIK